MWAMLRDSRPGTRDSRNPAHVFSCISVCMPRRRAMLHATALPEGEEASFIPSMRNKRIGCINAHAPPLPTYSVLSGQTYQGY